MAGTLKSSVASRKKKSVKGKIGIVVSRWNEEVTEALLVSAKAMLLSHGLSEKNIMDKNVTDHEPDSALFVPEQDPLIFYRNILKFAENHLSPEGIIFMEIHENFGRQMIEICKKYQFNATIKKDIFNKDRMIIASPYR